jgi:hypothetical protein
MDVHAVWIALRGLGVAAALTLHCEHPQVAPPSVPHDLLHEMSAELMRQAPFPLTVDQILASMGR